MKRRKFYIPKKESMRLYVDVHDKKTYSYGYSDVIPDDTVEPDEDQ